MLHHDDSIADRNCGSYRKESEARTRKRWFFEFQTPFTLPGTMYRGISARGNLVDFDLKEYQATTTKKCLFRVDTIEMKLRDHSTMSFNGYITIKKIDQDENEEKILKATLGKAFRMVRACHIWEKHSHYNCKLPLKVTLFLHNRYIMTVNVRKRGPLNGLFPSTKYDKQYFHLNESVLQYYDSLKGSRDSEERFAMGNVNNKTAIMVKAAVSRVSYEEKHFLYDFLLFYILV